MTLDKIEEAAQTYALGFADDVLKNTTPDFKSTFEAAVKVAFMAGVRYAIRTNAARSAR